MRTWFNFQGNSLSHKCSPSRYIILYIEGIKPSRSFQDCRLTLTYTATDVNGVEIVRLEDEVLMTVFQAKLTSSADHHVVYRKPESPGPLPVLEPVIASDNTNPGDPPPPDVLASCFNMRIHRLNNNIATRRLATATQTLVLMSTGLSNN